MIGDRKKWSSTRMYSALGNLSTTCMSSSSMMFGLVRESAEPVGVGAAVEAPPAFAVGPDAGQPTTAATRTIRAGPSLDQGVFFTGPPPIRRLPRDRAAVTRWPRKFFRRARAEI